MCVCVCVCVCVCMFLCVCCHPHTDCFIESQLFSVARRERCFKQQSKPG